VLDANSRALVYVYARETSNEANIARVLTFDEARRIAVNVARPPELLGVTASAEDSAQLADIDFDAEIKAETDTPFHSNSKH